MTGKRLSRAHAVRIRSVGAVGVFLCLTTAFGFWLSSKRSINASPNAGLVVPEDRLCLGSVYVDDRLAWKIPIHNPTSRNIEVADVESSCRCTSVQPSAFTVPAGETVEIVAHLDLSRQDWTRTSEVARPFAVRLAPVFNTPVSAVTPWEVHGQVRCPIAFSMPHLDLGESFVQGSQPPEADVPVVCLEPLQDLGATCVPALAEAEIVRSPGGGRVSAWTIHVSPNADLSQGPFKFDLTLSGNTAGGSAFNGIRIPVSGRVVPDAQVVPSQLVFGMVPLGDQMEQTVVVGSRTGMPIVGLDVASESKHLSVERSSVDAAPAEFRVHQPAAGLGFHRSEVTFTLRYEDEGSSEAVLPVSYFGLESPACAGEQASSAE